MWSDAEQPYGYEHCTVVVKQFAVLHKSQLICSSIAFEKFD